MNAEAQSTSTDSPDGALWLLRGLALAALVFSGYLTWVSFTSGRPLGCGAGSGGCEELLAGRWAYIGGLPVSLPAVSLFATLLAVLCFAGRKSPAPVRLVAWRVAGIVSLTAGAAALWFLGLQVFVLQDFCWYCLALHALSLSIAGTVIASRVLPLPRLMGCCLAGLLLTTIFAIAQTGLPAPRTYKLRTISREGAPRLRVALSGDATSEPRTVSILDGEIEIDSARVPVVGSAESDQMVVVVFDYSCPHCRKLRRQLTTIAEKSGDLAVLPLPIPQHPTCNSKIEPREASGEDACELARLALAVWRIKPAAFAEFDSWLLTDRQPPSAEAARREAARLVGKESLDKMLASGEVDRDLRRLIEMSQQFLSRIMPQLHHGERLLVGSVESAAELERILHREFGLAW